MTVRPATPSDVPRVRALCDGAIGKNFYTDEDFLSAIREKNKFLLVAANDENVPVAFLYFFVESLENAKNILHIPQDLHEADRFAGEKAVGVFKTTVTDPTYRGHGILTTLMRASEKILRAQGVKVIFLDALKLPSGQIPAGGGIEKMKFTTVTEIVRPWEKIPSRCPYCGYDFCRCNAILCMKEI